MTEPVEGATNPTDDLPEVTWDVRKVTDGKWEIVVSRDEGNVWAASPPFATKKEAEKFLADMKLGAG